MHCPSQLRCLVSCANWTYSVGVGWSGLLAEKLVQRAKGFEVAPEPIYWNLCSRDHAGACWYKEAQVVHPGDIFTLHAHIPDRAWLIVMLPSAHMHSFPPVVHGYVFGLHMTCTLARCHLIWSCLVVYGMLFLGMHAPCCIVTDVIRVHRMHVLLLSTASENIFTDQVKWHLQGINSEILEMDV